MDHIDETAVEVFMADVLVATPRTLTHCAIALEALVQRRRCDREHGPITTETLIEAQRRLRDVLLAEP